MDNRPPSRGGGAETALLMTRRRRKRQRDALVVHLSLLIQVLSILQLSTTTVVAASCAALGVSPGKAGESMGDGSGTVAAPFAALGASPGKSLGVVARRQRAQAQTCSAFVSSSFKKDRRDLRPGRAAARVHVGSQPRRTPRAAAAVFVAPPGPTTRRSCYGDQRPRHQGAAGAAGARCCRYASRRRPARRSSFMGGAAASSTALGPGVSTVPGHKRPLSMSAAAAAVAAAEAMASAAARVSCLPRPGSLGGGGGGVGDAIFSRSRPSMLGLRALAAGATGSNEPDGGERRRRRDRDGGGSRSVGVSAPLGALQALMSLVRWVLTGGRVGLRRQEQTTAGTGATRGAAASEARRRDVLHTFFQLFQWMWWPFAGLEGGIVARSSRARGSGGRAWVERRPKATGLPEQRAVLRPTLSAQQIQRSYPRPQSTAYPRPKVSAPTLLELDVEEKAEALSREQRLALAAAGDKTGGKDPLWGKFLVWCFERVITSRALVVEGLEVNVDARSNREAMSGLLQSVGITFNHLELENLQISGGARMNITGLDLKVMTLLWKRFGSFKKPFEIEGSYVLTSGDLAASAMVRRLVTNMMNSTLRKLETLATEPLRNSSITIKQVTAKRSRLVIDGEMAYDNAKVPFTYRTSIGVRGKGHVVYLKDAEVFWENVGGSLSLPLLPLETFDVDMGEGARIESIRIVNGQVALKCRVVISPFPPLLVASLRKRAAFRYDVAERLSVTFGNLVQNMKILNLQFRPNQA